MKPKVGDIVTLKPVKVLEIENGHVRIEASPNFMTWVSPSYIASIEPRPLKVGEMVTTGQAAGELLAICGEYAWVKWHEGPATLILRDLTRIGDA